MALTFKQLCEELEILIQDSYETGVTVDDAEKLAARFLYAQIQVSKELKACDLDARMRKSGVKAIRAAAYMEACQSDTKKPTEAAISAMIDLNKVVQTQQSQFDESEVTRDELERYYNIFVNAHIYYRGVAKGKFE